jgi:basic membrane lipoprotein Med (substrate-binding protein (PBP1-ABC) superfamily)
MEFAPRREHEMSNRRALARWLVPVVVLGVLAAACSKSTTGGGAGPTTGTTAGKPFKVAIVAPSAPNDLAFTQSMVDAANSLKSKYNLDIAVSDNLFVVEDAANAIRNYAEQGYDLVIAHGSQYGASIQQIAPQFPKVSFAWGTAGDTFGLPNVFAYQASSDQGGFVNGVMAAMLSKSDVIGVVGPIEVGDAKLYIDGFKAGVASVKPSAQVKVNYTGSFSDVKLASEAAKTFVQADVDVMTGSAQMVVGAVGVAKDDNVAWFGTQSNQTSLAPNIVVASQVYHWEVVLSQMVSAIKTGTLGGKSYTIDIGNGGEVVEFNNAFSLPADVKTKAEQAIAGLKDGSIVTGVSQG